MGFLEINCSKFLQKTTVIQYIAKTYVMHNRPMETVTGDAFELIKMQQALGFSSKIEHFVKFVDPLFTGPHL